MSTTDGDRSIESTPSTPLADLTLDDQETSYASAGDLSSAMRRASIAHGAHEARIGHADANWPDWYAAYMVAEHAGTPLPE
jgi:hypothetical protein